jgi:hypothetical protein
MALNELLGYACEYQWRDEQRHASSDDTASFDYTETLDVDSLMLCWHSALLHPSFEKFIICLPGWIISLTSQGLTSVCISSDGWMWFASIDCDGAFKTNKHGFFLMPHPAFVFESSLYSPSSAVF